MNFSKQTKAIIFIGTGGVGKTTTAASVAYGKAIEGFKVLVVTIDPSKRLAQAMNFKPDGNLHKIMTPAGQLYASTINHEKVFHDFLTQAVTKKIAVSEIYKNKLFLQLSTKLSQSQDFTTLFYLLQHVRSNDFDYVILDTPPAQHTWNFLNAAEKISALFSDEITSWFRFSNQDVNTNSKSFFKKIFQQGTLKVLNILQTLTGAEFFNELTSFFKIIEIWQQPLQEIISNCQRLLVSRTTEFVLVTSFDYDKFQLTQALSKKIYNEGYNLSHLIINMVPNWLDEESKYKFPEVEALKKLYQSTLEEMYRQITYFDKNLNVYKSYNLSQNLKHDDLFKIYNQISRI